MLHFYFAMRWLSIRLDALTTLVTFTVAVVVTLAKNYISQSYAAIALVYAAKVSQFIAVTHWRQVFLEKTYNSVSSLPSIPLMAIISQQKPMSLPPESCHISSHQPQLLT